MKRRLLNLFLWFKNSLNFRRPSFIILEFADCVFENKAYLLIQWKFKNAFCFSIDGLAYQSFNNCSSAYILLPKDFDEIQIHIKSSWRKQIRLLKLKKSELPFNVESKINANFKSFKKSHIQIATPKVKHEKVTYLKSDVTLQNLGSNLKILNLNYPL